MSDTGAMLHMQSRIDETKGVETGRALRWPAGVCCPTCAPSEMTQQGHDDTPSARQRDRCQSCGRRVDELTDTVFVGPQQPLRVWMLCLSLRGRNLSNAHMAPALELNTEDVHPLTCQLRPGLVAQQPPPTLAGAVACDEVDIVAGHQGKPEAVAKRGGADDADGSRASGEEARVPQSNHRFAG